MNPKQRFFATIFSWPKAADHTKTLGTFYTQYYGETAEQAASLATSNLPMVNGYTYHVFVSEPLYEAKRVSPPVELIPVDKF